MTETEEEYSSKVRTRVPTFDGDKAKRPFYKKKPESHLARSGLSELLTKKVGDAVERDNYVAPSSTSDEVKEEVKRIQKMNQKAAGILLNSILTDTEKGQSELDHSVAVLFYYVIYLITILMFSRKTLCLVRTCGSACVQNMTNI